jgi:hypothetical protein
LLAPLCHGHAGHATAGHPMAAAKSRQRYFRPALVGWQLRPFEGKGALSGVIRKTWSPVTSSIAGSTVT